MSGDMTPQERIDAAVPALRLIQECAREEVRDAVTAGRHLERIAADLDAVLRLLAHGERLTVPIEVAFVDGHSD